MTAPPSSVPYLFLKPGELVIAEQPCVVSTLLGSCVAVTMVSRRIGVGAICHALLPSCKAKDRCSCPERFRQVDCAIRGMIEEFARRGVPCSGIEAKIFGGAEMFHTGREEDGEGSVGRQNVVKAREVLAAAGVRIAAFDVGGLQGRKIFFCTHSGEVFLRRLNGRTHRQASLSPGRTGGAPS
jgi:chemotaxis protein CheD